MSETITNAATEYVLVLKEINTILPLHTLFNNQPFSYPGCTLSIFKHPVEIGSVCIFGTVYNEELLNLYTQYADLELNTDLSSHLFRKYDIVISLFKTPISKYFLKIADNDIVVYALEELTNVLAIHRVKEKSTIYQCL